MFYRPHNRVFAPEGGELVTKQDMAAECDIHNILGQYKRTGILAHIAKGQPLYEDLPSDIDFQAGLDTILAAQAAFDALPAKMRQTYGNDPARFLSALGDEANRAEFEGYGILKPRRPPPDATPPDATPPQEPPAA